MNLRKSIFSVLAGTALVMSSAAGLMAQTFLDDANGTAELNATCESVSSVDLIVREAFSANATSNIDATIDSDLVVDNFTIDVNMDCNWSVGWYLTASITEFSHPNPFPGTAGSFDGDLLTLTDGQVTNYTGPTIEVPVPIFPDLPLAKEPSVVDEPVWNLPVLGGAWTVYILGVPLPHASPGESTFQYDGQIVGMPGNLSNGLYTADLTIDLFVP